MSMYITCQIIPTQFLKNMGYKTKKFAIECKTERELQDILADLSSLEGINYIYTRKSKPNRECIFLTADNYIKNLHL